MGKCFSSEVEVLNNEKLFDDFFYLCRNLKYLIRVSQDSISKFKFENIIKIRKDSGVGYLSDGRIVVGGGTDNSGCLTNKVYLIDPVKSTVTILPDLPVSVKEGNFYHFKDCIYYIAAIKDTDDEEILAQEQSAPIMKYFLKTGSWEVFFEENEHKMNFQDYLKLTANKMNETIEEDDDQLSYKEILYPGSFMIGSKVYLINGQKLTPRDVDGFDFKVENFKSPLDAFRPICGSYLKTAFVTGGLLPLGKNCNFESYSIDFNSSSPEFKQQAGLKVDLNDNYPIIGSSKSFIALAFPYLAVFDNERNTWFQYSIDHKQVSNKNLSKSTPLLKTDAAESGATIKTKSNLLLAGNNVRIVNEDAPSGESLSDVDVSINVRLPPGLIIDEKVLKKQQEMSDSSHQRSSRSSRSSNTFSIEKRIALPESLKQKSNSSRSSSISPKANLKQSLKSRPIAGVLMIPQKPGKDLKVTSRSSQSSASSEIFQNHEVPRFSDSDSVISSGKNAIPEVFSNKIGKNKLKSSSSRSKSSSSSVSSLSFQAESSISSVSRNKEADKPMGQRLAPIKEGTFSKKLKELKFTYSEESSSESFEYEDENQ